MRKLGPTPNDLDERIRHQATANFRESLKSSFPHVAVESRTNGIIMLKDDNAHAAFVPTGNDHDAFSVFVKNANGQEAEFNPHVTRRELQTILDRYFQPQEK